MQRSGHGPDLKQGRKGENTTSLYKGQMCKNRTGNPLVLPTQTGSSWDPHQGLHPAEAQGLGQAFLPVGMEPAL